ncbi:MAG: DUF6702 family protein [Erythrobacter sp.]
MLRRWLAILALVLAPLAGATIASAHQQKIAISSIAVNPRTASLEVVHQVPVHDAEHALKRQGIAADIVASADSREAFARYVARRFKLEAGGKPVPLTYVGSEIEGGNLMVYQEAAKPRSGAMLSVNSQILTDVWARQENRVNIGSGTKVRTFVFTVNAPDKSFQL